MQSLTCDMIWSFDIDGPLTYPAKTTLLVVVSVSQATRVCGSPDDKYVSTTISEILSHTLSGCPSETDSLVNK